MSAATIDNTARIRELNDAFRKSFAGGRVLMTASLAEEPERVRAAVLQAVADFNAFTPDNDPHREHDWGSFQLFGQTWNWQIVYYDMELIGGSEDPADAGQTTRVLTIGPAADW